MSDTLDNALAAIDLYREAHDTEASVARWEAESAITDHAAAWAKQCLDTTSIECKLDADRLDDILMRATFDCRDVEVLRRIAQRLRDAVTL